MCSMEKSTSKRKSSTNISCVSKMSCFTASNDKPVRTSVHPGNEQSAFGDHQTNKTDGGLCKFKVSARKIYANLKKVRRTISPSGQFTNFVGGIFTNGDSNDPKKINESYLDEGCTNDVNAGVKSKSVRTSSRHKRNTGMEKTVRFCHVDVEVDEDCHRTNMRQPKVPHVDQKRNNVTANPRQPRLSHVDHKRNDVTKSCEDLKNYEFVLDFLRTRMMIFEDDCSIDWSSDLVEIERLSSFKN